MESGTILRHLRQASRQAYQHAPFRILRVQPVQAQRSLHLRHNSSPLQHIQAFPSSRVANHLPQIRRNSTEATSRPLTERADSTPTEAESIAARKAEQPSYQLTFTCKKCLHRSSHQVTKQAYHFGTTLITCPSCKNRHLISDHLKVFSDKSITLEDILKEKGQFLRKGRLGEDGDIEFYDEGSNEIGQAQGEAQIGDAPARKVEGG